MTPTEFIDALERTGKNQRSFAMSIGKRSETVSRWATGKLPIPEYAEIILKLAVQVIELQAGNGGVEGAPSGLDLEKSRKFDLIVVQLVPKRYGACGFVAVAPGAPGFVGDGETAAAAVADLEKAIADYEGAMERRARKGEKG